MKTLTDETGKDGNIKVGLNQIYLKSTLDRAGLYLEDVLRRVEPIPIAA